MVFIVVFAFKFIVDLLPIVVAPGSDVTSFKVNEPVEVTDTSPEKEPGPPSVKFPPSILTVEPGLVVNPDVASEE